LKSLGLDGLVEKSECVCQHMNDCCQELLGEVHNQIKKILAEIRGESEWDQAVLDLATRFVHVFS
jgi:hypothetical protein